MTSDELEAIISSKGDPISFEEMLKDRIPGLVLEFGVASGGTINEISHHCDKVYGFDSFKGLPEIWRTYEIGTFQCEVPTVPENVEFVIGLIQDTIDGFMNDHPEDVSFIHIDVDIYSATKCVLSKLKDRIKSGTIITFDEICTYEGYEKHEFKAFLEFLNETGFEIENLGSRHTEARTFRII
ncbi:Macrocin-O-methyltransferase [uncultured Caudovirales phage]|uniref:Macrocin-O-methyltransferase n=1 Tax=uncultured Caudovirales phage TaxID=2100421 RepID=A0A6J5QCH0_9CAUD|nr:Macrocin-O-methyltransferase [uncultured Caudovirales phage]